MPTTQGPNDPMYDKLQRLMQEGMKQHHIERFGDRIGPISEPVIEQQSRVYLDAIWPEIEGLQLDLKTSRERSKHLKKILDDIEETK